MSYIVKIDKPCSCFFKSELKEQKEFDDLAEAKDYSYQISKFANSSFCKTHFYTPNEQEGDKILIKVRLRDRKR